jgi:hypothetical protein
MARTTRRELRELRLQRAGRARTKRRLVAATTAGLMLVGSMALATHTINRDLTLNAMPTAVQYSDVLAFSGTHKCEQHIESSAPPAWENCTSADTIEVKYGLATATLAVSGSSTGTVAGVTWNLPWKVNAKPAIYDTNERAEASIGNEKSPKQTFTITKEDVVTAYTGPATGDTGATITLDATVIDNDGSAFANDPNLKGTVSFQLYDELGTTQVGSAVSGTLTNGALVTPKPTLVLPAIGTYKMKVSYTAASGGQDYYNNSESVFVTITVNAVTSDTGRAAPAVANEYINTFDSTQVAACKTGLGGNSWRGQIISAIAHKYNPNTSSFDEGAVRTDVDILCAGDSI